MNRAGGNRSGEESDRIFSLASGADVRLTVKGSRFLAFAGPVKTEAEAEAFVRALSKTHRDATHVCSAYRIGAGRRLQAGSSDAGEPSGTAGKPILGALAARNLSNAVCAVIRYFGGVKLGTGGLARAYAEAAAGVLDRAPKAELWITVPFRVRFPYELTGAVRSLMAKYHAVTDHTAFGDLTKMEVRVRRSLSDAFAKDLADATSGSVQAERIKDDEQKPEGGGREKNNLFVHIPGSV